MVDERLLRLTQERAWLEKSWKLTLKPLLYPEDPGKLQSSKKKGSVSDLFSSTVDTFETYLSGHSL
jgi:hypothetical protein